MPTTININWDNLKPSLEKPIVFTNEEADRIQSIAERLSKIAMRQLELKKAHKESFANDMAKWTSESNNENGDS